MLAALVGTGMAVAVLSAVTAHVIPRLSAEPNLGGRVLLVCALLGLVAAVSGLRILERYLAEKLGQDYVHEIRKRLVTNALSPGHGPSLGITVARTTNDLNSVRNWVTFGIAGAASGVPLILILTAALWLMAPPLAVAVMTPLLATAIVLGFLSRPAFARSRELRKARGRLAAQVTDALNAAVAVQAGGGVRRELGRIDKLGQEVAASAVRRAVLAGSLRASSTGAAAITAVSAAATGAFVGLEHGLVVAALTVVGMIAVPVQELGRIVEYRQSYRAACRSMLPGLALAVEGTTAEGTSESAPPPSGGGEEVEIAGLTLDRREIPRLRAQPGECVLARSADHEITDQLFHAILGFLPPERLPEVRVGGQEMLDLEASDRRRYIGYAARGLALERGKLARAVRYRCPDASDAQLREVLRRTGLEEMVSGLPRGIQTLLRRGGHPLSTPARAKLQLARAILGEPPLLLLNRIDADLDEEGHDALREILAGYPGVAMVATDRADLLPDSRKVWDLDSVNEVRA